MKYASILLTTLCFLENSYGVTLESEDMVNYGNAPRKLIEGEIGGGCIRPIIGPCPRPPLPPLGPSK